MKARVALAAIGLAASRAAMAADSPICADRPGKANPTCTVPAGRLQVESGLIDWSRDESGGVASDSLAIGSTAFKYGLNGRWHIELDLAPVNLARTHGPGLDERDSGFGDVFIRSKYRLTHDGGVQVALDPFVKIPTASHSIGNGRVEAGVALPVDWSLPGSTVGITLGPEIDWIANDDDHGHHLAMVQVISVGWQATDKLNLSTELWGQWNWDPAGTTRQATADAAIAFLVNSDVQLDTGANFGLNRATPDVEIYAGMSTRF
jgi:hypothetical protein